ncbi:MAG: T9SS type A sorting domain-containing protein [Bacteroidales bacterium]|nr:T9SS type A sorting domain-containing protein [Bacteroidales bacterium]
MTRYLFYILLSMIWVNSLNGQEILTGLSENPLIIGKNENPANVKSSVFVKPVPVKLPFFDNFKQQSFYPDTSHWMDNDVFINNDYPLFPPTWNVATFDAIDANGSIYGEANFLQFVADHLTSKPIRLDSVFSPQPALLTPADSVYLSFYYQPQGRANDPQVQDSLVLEFGYYTEEWDFKKVDSITVEASIYGVDTLFPGDVLISPCDPSWEFIVTDTLLYTDLVTLPCDSVFVPATKWERVWAAEGMPLDTFLVRNGDFYFRQVMIPIVDTNYFRSDFQFRFFNYASISNDNLQSWQSNCDQWNIDYVLLDKGRSRLDTTHKALSFVGTAPSFLEKYQSMPYYQYSNDPTGVMKLGLEMFISNLDNGNQTAKYYYEVKSDVGTFHFGWDGGSGDLRPFNQWGYTTISSFAFPPVTSFFPPFGDRDSIYFDITHYLEGDLQLGLVDTLRFRQKFYNYYAYDDGTPEFGYGLSPAGAQLAYRFDLSRRDTLRAIQMYFNKTLTGANEQFFDLAVWSDLNGRPGDLIYILERQKPRFSEELNSFYTYHLDSAVPVQGTFYVGWIQRTSHNLNIGFDSGNDASDNMYYNVTGEWLNSGFNGALMIRPLLGEKLKEEPAVKSTVTDQFLIVPNPTYNGQVSFIFQVFQDDGQNPKIVELDEEKLQHLHIEVFNLVGQKVFESRYTQTIDLSDLKTGVYLLRLTDLQQQSAMVQKLVIGK